MTVSPPKRLYVCSKVSEMKLWRTLRSHGLPIISRWIDIDSLDETDQAAIDHLWHTLVPEDLANATDVLFLHRPGDEMKGSVAEASHGVMLGRQVHLVTKHSRAECRSLWGTWPLASNVRHYFSLNTALADMGFTAPVHHRIRP